MNMRASRHIGRGAFTLTELLVVIGIIIILIGILIPVVSGVRNSANEANTRNLIAQISNAINLYHQDHRAYPGPFSNAEIRNGGLAAIPTVAASGFTGTLTGGFQEKITGAENLVLALLGGLFNNETVVGNPPDIQYNPSFVGQGPRNLVTGQPKKHQPYLQEVNLSWRDDGAGKHGHYIDNAAEADDTIIPEILDNFPTGMPILYLRATVGANTPGATAGANPVVTQGSYGGQYQSEQIIGYTGTWTAAYAAGARTPDRTASTVSGGGTSIGEGRKIKPEEYIGTGGIAPLGHGLQWVLADGLANTKLDTHYPYDLHAFLRSPQNENQARQKDGYILISAGSDRVYGTSDDITSFGAIAP